MFRINILQGGNKLDLFGYTFQCKGMTAVHFLVEQEEWLVGVNQIFDLICKKAVVASVTHEFCLQDRKQNENGQVVRRWKEDDTRGRPFGR